MTNAQSPKWYFKKTRKGQVLTVLIKERDRYRDLYQAYLNLFKSVNKYGAKDD